MASKVVDYIESLYSSNGQCGVGNSYDLVDALRIIKEEIINCKEENDKIMKAQENKA